MITNLIRKAFRAIGLDIRRVERRTNVYVDQPAWNYQSSYVLPHFTPGDRVIDIGCGATPSPIATVLTDFFPDESIHRARPMVEDRPLIVCSATRMPLRDGCFDLSICSHVLEHVPDPDSAAREIARVSRRGYLETPAYGKDVLVGTGNQHIWQIVPNQGTFHFFPYTSRQHQAQVNSPIMNIWCQNEFHPWQPFFWERHDIFNAIQFWEGAPRIEVHDSGASFPAAMTPVWRPVSQDKIPDAPPSLNQQEIALLEDCLTTPDGLMPMHYESGSFVDATRAIIYPVRTKRIYFEIGD
ncbi:MAG: class I SAM-dependent methyltransferase [Betaproteobacteria bacterium]|nr:class I SAM-dependent methyltransferase [Betaproteobacteria bacterium]